MTLTTREPYDPGVRHLFVCDPLDTFLVDRDTTIAFMREADRRRHEVFSAEAQTLALAGGAPHARACEVRLRMLSSIRPAARSLANSAATSG